MADHSRDPRPAMMNRALISREDLLQFQVELMHSYSLNMAVVPDDCGALLQITAIWHKVEAKEAPSSRMK